MDIVRIAAPGLSAQDRLVLSSALRFLGKHGRGWSLVEDEAEAVVVLRRLTHTHADRGATPHASPNDLPQWVRLDVDVPGVDMPPANLMLPLRARELLPHLRSAESALERLSESLGGESRYPASASPVVARMLADTSPLWQAPALVRVGPRHELLIESSDTTAATDLRRLGWRSWSIPDLASLCEQVRLGAAVSLESAPVSEASSAPPRCSGNVGQLVWALALHDPQPMLAPALRRDQPFALLRWPDVRGVPLQGTQLRLAALLARGALSVQQLVERTKAPEGEVVAFVNACHWLGYLETGGASISAPSAHPSTAPSTRGLGRLVESIRAALRGAAARESR